MSEININYKSPQELLAVPIKLNHGVIEEKFLLKTGSYL